MYVILYYIYKLYYMHSMCMPCVCVYNKYVMCICITCMYVLNYVCVCVCIYVYYMCVCVYVYYMCVCYAYNLYSILVHIQ